MTLHARESIRSSPDESVYSSKDISKAAPRYRFPTDEWRPEDAFAVVSDELMLDGNARQNLATLCPASPDLGKIRAIPRSGEDRCQGLIHNFPRKWGERCFIPDG